MKKDNPKVCRDCVFLWIHGSKDNSHNKWCTKFGSPTWSIIGHCKLNSGFVNKLTTN